MIGRRFGNGGKRTVRRGTSAVGGCSLRARSAPPDTGLEKRVRSGELSPALEAHLSKYRGLVPKLALVSHLADGAGGPVSETALLRALALVEYLESHARRLYASGSEADAAAAKAIIGHIRRGDLQDGFTAREVYRKSWARLDRLDRVQAGLDLLVDLGWLAAEDVATGGRPKVVFNINPTANR